MKFLSLAVTIDAIRLFQAPATNPSQAAGPSAGSTPLLPNDPTAQVRKDGFYMVKCMNDAMREHADNQSAQGKKRYAAGNVGVSVIWYHETIPKVDQEPMDARKCFNFCRIQERMGFFGLVHGRECYCTPYYRQQPGGEGDDCSLPCPGNQAEMCGGKTKSTIYQMHFCDDSAKDIGKAKDSAAGAVADIQGILDDYYECQQNLQGRGQEKEAAFTKIGAQAASDYMQEAKIRAGQLKRLLEKCADLKKEHDELIKDPSPGFTAIEKQEYLEGQVINLQDFANRVNAFYDDAEPEFLKSCVQKVAPTYKIKDEYRAIQYYGKYNGIEYDMTVCKGEMLETPLFLNEEECAARCRDTIGCEAFNVFGVAGGDYEEVKILEKYPQTGGKGKGGFLDIEHKRRRQSTSTGMTGSCASHCGGDGGGCWCDAGCMANQDCCPDYAQVCKDKSGICVMLKNATSAKLFTAHECPGYEAPKVMTQCFYRFSESTGLEVKYDEERQWCKTP